MYYSSGNYEAFSHPKKPEGVDSKSAYIIGSGLAALTAACYLVRDGQMKGEHIHIFEKDPVAGGACDGRKMDVGYVMRGGREMDNHFEVMWDLLHDIPSLEHEGQSVLDEYYWLNKEDPNSSLCRATVNRGEDAHTDGKFAISDKGAMEIMRLFFTPDEQLQDKRITDFFDDEVFSSNFWLYWRTMFAFENWHSALEMKRYLQRYIHHIGGLPDFTALRFTRYNQYESMILPMVKYLEGFGVQFHFGVQVTNVEFDCKSGRKVAKRIDILENGAASAIDLTENDLVFITNGGCVENSSMGSQNTPAPYNTEIKEGGGWDMWRKIAAQDPAFGHPDKFCYDPEQTNWMSATVETLDQRIIPYITKICKRDPFSGKVVTGGIVTVKDSSWLMSWTINRQPQFREQPKGQLVGCAFHVVEQDVQVVGVDQRLFAALAEKIVRVRNDVLVEGGRRCDHDHQRFAIAPARAPGLLPGAGDGAGIAAQKAGLQLADVDAQFQCVGRRHDSDFARAQRALNFAPLRGQIAAAVAAHAAGKAVGGTGAFLEVPGDDLHLNPAFAKHDGGNGVP